MDTASWTRAIFAIAAVQVKPQWNERQLLHSTFGWLPRACQQEVSINCTYRQWERGRRGAAEGIGSGRSLVRLQIGARAARRCARVRVAPIDAAALGTRSAIGGTGVTSRVNFANISPIASQYHAPERRLRSQFFSTMHLY